MGLYAAVGALVYSRNQTDGLIILQGAEARANELAELARYYPALYKVLKAMTTGNAWMSLIIGHSSMMIAIMANHDMLPPGLAQMFMAVGQAKNMMTHPMQNGQDNDLARASEHYAQYDTSQSFA